MKKHITLLIVLGFLSFSFIAVVTFFLITEHKYNKQKGLDGNPRTETKEENVRFNARNVGQSQSSHDITEKQQEEDISLMSEEERSKENIDLEKEMNKSHPGSEEENIDVEKVEDRLHPVSENDSTQEEFFSVSNKEKFSSVSENESQETFYSAENEINSQ